jgi:hypothetical protein
MTIISRTAPENPGRTSPGNLRESGRVFKVCFGLPNDR